MQQTTQARRVTLQEQEELGLAVRRSNYVAPGPAPLAIPTRHEVIDPYAQAMPQPVQYVVQHTYTPTSRAHSVLIRTSAVTVALAILTIAAAMFMLDTWGILCVDHAGEPEWCVCFVIVAVLDWRETPSALTWKQTNDYMYLMKTEQTARLKAIYGLEV